MEVSFKILDFSKMKHTGGFEAEISFFLKNWFSESESVEVQTSGSTGKPKVLTIEKEKMLHSAKMTIDFLGLSSADYALVCLPIAYISGKMMLVRAILAQMKVKIVEPSLQPLQALSEKIDFCAMTPLQVENSLEQIHWIKKLIIGGAEVSSVLKSKIHQTLLKAKTHQRYEVYETYGMSETLSHIALKQIFPNQEEYFTILNQVEIGQNENGCLWIIAPQISAEKLQTNDIVELKNNRQFKFLGRTDNVINSGGAKIFPEELEGIVKRKITNELVFIGVEDEVLGQKLVLVIEGKEEENSKSLINQVSFEKKFFRPKEVVFIPKIPRTENGKIDRLATLKLLTTGK